MTEHEEVAKRAEREVDDMQARSDDLGKTIGDVREDWEQKKADSSVPGAAGDPQRAEGGLPPEANYTTSGDNPPDDDGGENAREPWQDE
jgi:hypothetical protein